MKVLSSKKLFLIILSCTLLFSPNLQARIISGTVSRAESLNADTAVTVKIELLNGLPWWTTVLGDVVVTIPANVQSTTFSFDADENLDGQIRYTLPDGHIIFQTDGTGYYKYGFYQSSGNTTWDYSFSSPPATFPADSSAVSEINLQLVAGHRLSGSISLPATQDDDAAVLLSAGNMTYENCGEEIDRTPYHILTAASRSADYSLLIPDTADDFCLSFRTYANTPFFEKSVDYFPGQTTIKDDGSASSNMGEARLFPAGQEFANVNITMLTAHPLSGYVLLPFPAPHDLTIDVFVRTGLDRNCIFESDLLSLQLNFLQGETQKEYLVSVPDDAASFCLNYSSFGEYKMIDGQFTYFPSPYWNRGHIYPDMHTGSDEFQVGLVTTPPSTDIDISVLEKRTVSGKLTRSSADIPLSLSVTAMCAYTNYGIGTVNSSENSVHFDQSILEMQYKASVAEDCPEIYEVSYTLDTETTGYIRKGYFNTTGTTWVYSLADPLPTADHEDIDFSILNANYTISGTINSPQSMDTPYTVQIWLSKESETGEYNSEFFSDVTIPTGGDNASYKIQVPDDETVAISYSLTNSDTYLSAGYYSEVATRRRIELADWLFTNQNLTEVNLTLLDISPLTGDLNLDEHIDLSDIIISLQLLINNSTELYANFWDMDVNHDYQIGLAETIDLLQQVSETCSIRHSEFCTDINLCINIHGYWFNEQCQVFAGEWAGIWESRLYSNNGTLRANFTQDGNNVTGTVRYTGSICNNDIDLPVAGTITDGLLTVTSDEYQCGTDTAVIQYSHATVNNNVINGDYSFTGANIEVDDGTFYLNRD